MAFKDKLLFVLCAPVVAWSMYEAYNIVGYTKQLATEHAECYKPNPYKKELFFGTMIILAILMVPIQAAG